MTGIVLPASVQDKLDVRKNADADRPMNKGQSFAMFCATDRKINTKPVLQAGVLSHADASALLADLNGQDQARYDAAITQLLELGATEMESAKNEHNVTVYGDGAGARGGDLRPVSEKLKGGQQHGSRNRKGKQGAGSRSQSKATKKLAERIYNDARLAGLEAADADGLSDKYDGYAVVNVSGTSAFGRYVRDAGIGEKNEDDGGVDITVYEYESYARNRNFVDAFVDVLVKHDVSCDYVTKMLD